MKTDHETGANDPCGKGGACDVGEMALSDADIAGAMAHIPGYLDISIEDFRTLYHLAHKNALDHLVGGIRARQLMRGNCRALTTDMTMDRAAAAIAESGYKGLAVVDVGGQVVGMLTETDFLRRLKAETFLELMLRLMTESSLLSHRCHETRVAEVMTTPTTTVHAEAGFRELLQAFRAHPGRSMPVVDDAGRFLGMVLRKDFMHVLDRGLHVE